MSEQRNFRSSYFEKVGIKGVEEKKSIELLLKEQLRDRIKLEQFCLRFTVPTVYRTLVWKILLGISPRCQNVSEAVERERLQQYNDLSEAVSIVGCTTADTKLEERHYFMYIMQDKYIPFDKLSMLQELDAKIFLSMSKVIQEFTDDSVDIYWLTYKIFLLHAKYSDSHSWMISRLEKLLHEEDSELFSHLQRTTSFASISFTRWLQCGFAGVLSPGAVLRIWDKIIGGSFKIMIFVALAMLITFRKPILSMPDAQDIVSYLQKIPIESGDLIVTNGIEIWQKYGSPLVPGLKT